MNYWFIYLPSILLLNNRELKDISYIDKSKWNLPKDLKNINKNPLNLFLSGKDTLNFETMLVEFYAVV